MKAFIATVLLVVPIIAQAQTTTRNEAAEKEVAKLERELHQARVGNDVAAVNGLLAPGFLHHQFLGGGPQRSWKMERKGPYNTTPNGDRREAKQQIRHDTDVGQKIARLVHRRLRRNKKRRRRDSQ